MPYFKCPNCASLKYKKDEDLSKLILVICKVCLSEMKLEKDIYEEVSNGKEL